MSSFWTSKMLTFCLDFVSHSGLFNNLTSLKLNLDTMKEMVIEDTSKEINVEQLNFIRNKKEWGIKTEVGNKTIKNTYNKRQVLENMVETIPFGY